MFYFQPISCFAWTQTSYHVVPCWSSTLQAAGNTFQDRSHIFLPVASLSAHKVIFPPAAKGTSVFQNIMIYNNDANTPLRFVCLYNTIFTCFTCCSVIIQRETCAEMCPNDVHLIDDLPSHHIYAQGSVFALMYAYATIRVQEEDSWSNCVRR